MGKNRRPKKRASAAGKAHPSKIFQISDERAKRLHHADPMGASWRSYPRGNDRQSVIEQIRAKPETERSGDDWWQLGEYQVLEGLAAGDETIINSGSQALMKGAHLSPPHAGCLLDLGWLLCYRGLDQMAIFYLDQALTAAPNSRDVWSLRGWACIGAADREQAIVSFEKAVALPGGTEIDRNTLSALKNGKSLETLRKDLVLTKFDDEILRAKNGDPKEAARSGVIQLRQLLARKPDDIDLAYGLAYCHYVLGQLEHAEPLMLRVIGEAPEHADALTLLGLISMKRQRPEQQREYYERAVRANPSHVLANTNLASILQDNGDFHAARPLLLRAIEAAPPGDPHLAIALDLLGNSYGSIERDYAKEADLHRQAIALEPKRPIFHANLIVSLLSAGRPKDARRAFRAAKDLRLALPNHSLVENLVRLYQDRTLHPYEYMQVVEQLSPVMGWPALKLLVKYAWNRRNVVEPEERVEFLNGLGLMASTTGDRELALEIWRYGCTVPGGEFFSPNVVVELSNLGRHGEALEAAETMLMSTPRSWTILGNTRLEARQYKLALEAYRTALEKDERFLLPIANAISAARMGFLAEELDPFVLRLRSDWQSSLKGTALLGQALVLQGKLSSAAQCFEKALWNNDTIRTPEELWASERDTEDLSLLGHASLEDHYHAAKCFLALGRLDLLMELARKVYEWPKWMNGDWMVLRAEAHLAAGDLNQAEAIVESMSDQPPPRVVAAKIAIVRGDAQKADAILKDGLEDHTASAFSHPEGRPDAMFRALAAERALESGNPEEAENLAREAVRQDPTCVRARLALIGAIEGRCPEEEFASQIMDGLRRSPGHPGLMSALVVSLISAGKPELADQELDQARAVLYERAAGEVAHRLGEAIAIDRLSRIAPVESPSPVDDADWPWLEKLQSPLREWMRGANLSLNRGEELSAAYTLYVSKVAEYLLVEKVMLPFRNTLLNPHAIYSERHRDIARFLGGGVPPSIGAIARLIDSASRPARALDDEITKKFRLEISKGNLGAIRSLLGSQLIGQLIDLGRARNMAAHLGEADIAFLLAATRCVVADGRPGDLFEALGVPVG